MAYIEISNLPETLNLDDNSVFPAVYQGETKKVSFSSLKSLMKFFKSASYNKTTGVFTFGLSDTTQATLNTDLNLSIKDIELEDYTLTLTKQDGTTETITLPQQDLSNFYTKSQADDKFVDKETGLTDYVKNTDYATSSVGGVVKVNSQYGLALLEDGTLRGVTADYTTYGVRSNNFAISKGTLENVLNARIGDIATLLDTINGEII